jgi:sortase A
MLGVLCSAAGALLATIAGLNYLRGSVAQAQARGAWRELDSLGLALSAESYATRPGLPVARLRIPSIGLDLIVVEGVGPRQLNAGPGHFPGSVLPGDVGNAIISAHRDRHFHRFDELGAGDTVITETMDHRVTWRIAQRSIVSKDERALFLSPRTELTLTTCWPVRYFGPAPDRLILVAEPIDVDFVRVASAGGA